MYYIQKISFPPNSLVYICIRILGENDFLFPSLNICDAFELDVNVVNFVYYGKTRLEKELCCTKPVEVSMNNVVL